MEAVLYTVAGLVRNRNLGILDLNLITCTSGGRSLVQTEDCPHELVILEYLVYRKVLTSLTRLQTMLRDDQMM